MKLIKADQLIDKEYGKYGCDPAYFWQEDPLSKCASYLIEVLEMAPEVDAVEVIRCKDCKWFCGTQCGRQICMAVKANDFCSYGEK